MGPANRLNGVMIKPQDHIQNQTGLPVCRVHVYKRKQGPNVPYLEAAKLPTHWAGRPGATWKDPTSVPDLIIGRSGVYLNPDLKQPVKDPAAMPWHVLTARVNLTRQWSCSSANIQIACALTGEYDVPAPPIAPNDVIVIEMGYVASLQTAAASKDTNWNTNYNNFAGDVVFYGMVDTIKERGGAGEQDGVVLTILARDAMSLLVDNKIRGQYVPKATQTFNRAYVIRDLLWRGGAIDYVKWIRMDVGDTPGDENVPGLRRPHYIEDGVIEQAAFGPENCSIRIGRIERSRRKDIPANQSNQPQSSIVLMDRFPLDVIKHFSLVETAPKELWADHRTGEIHWLYRRTDMRRLVDPANKHHRQYFYRFPAERANILSYTAEWSTAGTVTHFTLTNPLAHIQEAKKVADIYAESKTAELVDPHTGHLLRPIVRNRFVYDDTLINSDEAAFVADALFHIWGRAIETGMVMIPGDPTLEIGEGVQLFNMGMFGRRLEPMPGGNFREKPENPEKGQFNPMGVHRVEAVTHMFATGGVQQGFKSVFVFGPPDDNAGNPKRIIQTEDDLKTIQLIDVEGPQGTDPTLFYGIDTGTDGGSGSLPNTPPGTIPGSNPKTTPSKDPKLIILTIFEKGTNKTLSGMQVKNSLGVLVGTADNFGRVDIPRGGSANDLLTVEDPKATKTHQPYAVDVGRLTRDGDNLHGVVHLKPIQ